MAKTGLKLIILPSAKADLDDIFQYIAKGSVKYARLEKKLIAGFIDKLYEAPLLGKPFEHNSIIARQSVFRNYLIIYLYKEDEDVIEILTIHHHSRSISRNPAFNSDEDM